MRRGSAEIGHAWRFVSALCLLTALCGCEENKKTSSVATASPGSATVEPPAPLPPPKRAPELAVDEISPKVGFSRAVLFKPDGKPNPEGQSQLVAELTEAKDYVAGKDVTLTVHRQAKTAWVTAYLAELGKLGPSSVSLQTETRSDYPKQIKVVPQNRVEKPAACSLVGMILENRATAIWRLSGGTARKRDRGMGGPDLTMTGDTIESMAKGCKESSLFFVQGAEGVEWGLVYDLAASALAHPKAGLDVAVILNEPPVAGHPVELK
jgi:hypothetical protein